MILDKFEEFKQTSYGTGMTDTARNFCYGSRIYTGGINITNKKTNLSKNVYLFILCDTEYATSIN